MVKAIIMTTHRESGMKSTSTINVSTEYDAVKWVKTNICKYGNTFKKWSAILLDGVDYSNKSHFNQIWTILYNKVDQYGAHGKTVVFSMGANGYIQGSVVEDKIIQSVRWEKKPL